jgi:hypothetical protein
MIDDSPRDSSGEINPYASPQVPDPRKAYADAGIGVWRDGELVVMHERSVLPAFCVKTGRPTLGGATVEMYRMELSSIPRRIRIPLASRWRIWPVRFIEQAAPLGLGLMFGTLLTALVIRRATGWEIEMYAAVAAGAAFILLVACGMLFGEPLHCVRSEGSYVWLQGADRRYLDRLPEWPYG